MLEGILQLFRAERSAAEVLRDLCDILIVAFLVYRALCVLKGTRAMQIGIGFLVFGLLYMMAKYAALDTLLGVLSLLAQSAILILVVVFQNDIRRALIRVGATASLGRGRAARERVVDEVVAAATELARHRMGAILCLERDANVLEFVTSDGIELDSTVTRELLVSLFVPEAVNKTHDGAVLIRDLKIARAGIFFPMPETTRVLDPTLGSRHRAAIGITEETDAVVVVVSEERGTITLCFPNGMVQNIDAASLKQALVGLLGTAATRRLPLVGRLRQAIARRAPAEPEPARGAGESERPAGSDATTPRPRPAPERAAALERTPTPLRLKLPAERAPGGAGGTGRHAAIPAQPMPPEPDKPTPTPGTMRTVSVPMPVAKDLIPPPATTTQRPPSEGSASSEDAPSLRLAPAAEDS
jgi:uncharacterized protein (TIGR00159 family)